MNVTNKENRWDNRWKIYLCTFRAHYIKMCANFAHNFDFSNIDIDQSRWKEIRAHNEFHVIEMWIVGSADSWLLPLDKLAILYSYICSSFETTERSFNIVVVVQQLD